MRIPTSTRVLAVATLAMLTVTACSTSNAPSVQSSASGSGPMKDGTAGTARAEAAHAGKVTIRTTDQLMFAPSVITTRVGTLTVTLTDEGSYPHNLSVPGLHVTSQTVSGDPGSTSTTVTLNFSKPGRYPFVCTYHASAGMRGQFIVT